MKAPTETGLKAVLAGVCTALTFAVSARAADLYVPGNYPTIQAAVDAAHSNDTIHIAAGVYAGQILISDKSLTLSGSPGAVLRVTSGMSQPYSALGSSLVPLLGILRSEVVVSNLTFEGEHLAENQQNLAHAGVLQAIYFFGSGGRVENCRITGFRGNSLGAGTACGLRVVNPVSLGTSPVTNQVLRCTFADSLISIALGGDSPSWLSGTFDPTLIRTTFVVSDNTITGNGPDASGTQVGIQIGAGATGEVSRNTVSDHSYVGTTDPTPFAIGILADDANDFGQSPLAALQPIRFESNVLRNNQLHLVVLRGDGSTIVDNTLDGTAPGLRPMGLGVSGENLVIARNRFSSLPQGIVLFGNDPDFGTYLGIAHNAQLNTNRFCNVTNTLTVEPLATDTEQGTLTCPFPAPALAITPAVLLSWPIDEDGWTVESAPAVDGPWTPLIATPFVQGDRKSVAVPTDAQRRFFRLR
ncbi:MAG TPA: right-handed parallel beta-helix repeat-containing protein [Verrucomicrobiae bacterium]